MDKSELLINDFIYLYVTLASNFFEFGDNNNIKLKLYSIYAEWINKYKNELEIFEKNNYKGYIEQIVASEQSKINLSN